MNASMKALLAGTRVTVFGGTESSPGRRKSGATAISRSDIGRGNCGSARSVSSGDGAAADAAAGVVAVGGPSLITLARRAWGLS
jgi:hypothetical protein